MKHRSGMAAAVVLALVSTAGFARSAHASSHPTPYDPVPGGWPKVVSIPKIGVRAPIESLALNRPTDFKAPYKWSDVVWYDRGPRPGDMGRANVFGHLDSTCCPAIFYRLRDLRKGDIIYVGYRSGVLRFQVQWSQVYWNSHLPLKWEFGTTRERGLVLITCTGVFHRDGTGYDRKLFVYTTLVWPRHR